ncbi:MAG: hypothetical protein IIC15_07310 [Thaumarchaeota archaeon]|nr:hypothetical protein [Nitrososphaerota archaeon]
MEKTKRNSFYGKIKGELSSHYMPDPKVPKILKSNFQDLKVWAVIRNPVERAFSNYQHNIRDKKENFKRLRASTAIILRGIDIISIHAYVARYVHKLRTLEMLFDVSYFLLPRMLRMGGGTIAVPRPKGHCAR